MKIFRKTIISFILVLSMIITVPVAHALSAGALSAAQLLLSALVYVNQQNVDAAEKARQIDIIYYSFSSYNATTSDLIWVSGDDLSAIVVSLINNGVPCAMEYKSSLAGTGESGYIIRCTAHPHYVWDPAQLIDPNRTYVNKYFGTYYRNGSTYVPKYVVSKEKYSSSILKDIYSDVHDIWADVDATLSALTINIGGVAENVASLCYSATTSLTSIDSTLSTISGKLTYTSGSTSYSIANLVNSVKSNTSTISSRLYSGSKSAATWLADTYSYLATLNSSIGSVITNTNNLSSIATDVSDIKSSILDNHFVATTLTDNESNTRPTVIIPYNVATDIVSYLNNTFLSGRVTVVGNDNATYQRYFVRAYLDVVSGTRYIRCVYSGADNLTASEYRSYLADPHATVFIVSDPEYLSTLTSILGNVDDVEGTLTTIDGHVDQLENYVDGVEGALTTVNTNLNTIKTSLTNITGYVDGVETSLYYNPNTDYNPNNLAISAILYESWQRLIDIDNNTDGIESTLSTISSNVDQVEGRMIKTVSGTSYTLADLLYNSWQRMIDIDNNTDDLEGYVDGLEGSLLSTNSILGDISYYTYSIWENMNYITTYSATSRTDSNNVVRDTFEVPYLSACSLIASLNYYHPGHIITVYAQDGSDYEGVFVRAYLETLSNITYVRVTVEADTNEGYRNLFLCDEFSALLTVDDPEYSSTLSQVLTALGDISVNTDNSSSSFTAIVAPITGWIDANTDIQLILGTLPDLITDGFDSVTDALELFDDSRVLIPYIDQLEGYTDGVENALSTLNSNTDNLESLTTTTNTRLNTLNNSLSTLNNTLQSNLRTYVGLDAGGNALYATVSDTTYAIYEWLTLDDISGEPTVITIIQDWGQDLENGISRFPKVLELFRTAFGFPLSISSSDWNNALEWFGNFDIGEP